MVLALIESGQHARAAAAALTLLANCLAQSLQAEATSAQLTVAAAYAAAGQPTLAMPHVLNALFHATALHLDLLAAAAVVALAEVKLALSIEHAAEARALVRVRAARCDRCFVAEGACGSSLFRVVHVLISDLAAPLEPARSGVRERVGCDAGAAQRH